MKGYIPTDETFSLVSDTWSTDVLASDSETVEQQPQRPLQPVLHEFTTNNPLVCQFFFIYLIYNFFKM